MSFCKVGVEAFFVRGGGGSQSLVGAGRDWFGFRYTAQPVCGMRNCVPPTSVWVAGASGGHRGHCFPRHGVPTPRLAKIKHTHTHTYAHTHAHMRPLFWPGLARSRITAAITRFVCRRRHNSRRGISPPAPLRSGEIENRKLSFSSGFWFCRC